MRQKSNSTPASSETLVRNIRRATHFCSLAYFKAACWLRRLRGLAAWWPSGACRPR